MGKMNEGPLPVETHQVCRLLGRAAIGAERKDMTLLTDFR
jgi:hypothetical protein